MYEKEEEQLEELRKQLDLVTIPSEQLDGAISQGFERAKREKMKKRKVHIRKYGMLAAVVLLLVTLVTTIRISPTFAHAVSSIPGLEKIVAMIHYDKGLTAAIENDYFQEINASQTKGNLTLIIDGVILDESGMSVFYTAKSDGTLKSAQIQNVELRNAEIGPSSISHGMWNEDVKEFSNRIDFHFAESTKLNDLTFSLRMTINEAGKDIEFIIPFTVPEKVKQSHKFLLNREEEIENQKFTIEEVTIHPLRIEVRISINPNNSKKILLFPDIRLEDENGEVWGSSLSGISGRGIGELEQIIFLQSNYFEKPKELYLRINKLQALNKDEATVIIDSEKNILLNSPSDGRLKLAESNKSHVDLFLTQAEEDEHFSFTTYKIVDANGKLIRSPSSSMQYDSGKMESHFVFDLETTDYKNPIHLEIDNYPKYIDGNVKIELKNPNK